MDPTETEMRAEFFRQYPDYLDQPWEAALPHYREWQVGFYRSSSEAPLPPSAAIPGLSQGGGNMQAGFPAVQNWAGDNAAGVQDLSDRQLEGRGVGNEGQGPMVQQLNQDDYNEQHSRTYVPIPWRLRHKRIGSGRHDAMLGNRSIVSFHNKRTCAAYCRAWNLQFAILGAASPFLAGDFVQAFADMVIAGSGSNGLANGFSPPFAMRQVV